MRPARRRSRETLAERRERRSSVSDVGEVLDAAARFLETRSRSVAEVRRRLASAGYRAEIVGQAIERLSAQGYLDDEAFARSWVESRDRARPRGERALRAELLQKGVDRQVIELVLADRDSGQAAGIGPATEDDAQGPTPSADQIAAERLLERHRRALGRVIDPAKRRQRAYALLARNGFDPEICREAVTTFLAPSAETLDDAAEDTPDDRAHP